MVEKELSWTKENRCIYERWQTRTPQEVLAWHRQVQDEVLAALELRQIIGSTTGAPATYNRQSQVH